MLVSERSISSLSGLRMKQRPPVARNVEALDKVLRLSTGDVRSVTGGREWMGGIITDIRRGGLFEIGPQFAPGDEQQTRQRNGRPTQPAPSLLPLFKNFHNGLKTVRRTFLEFAPCERRGATQRLG